MVKGNFSKKWGVRVHNSAKFYYEEGSWDLDSWLNVISVEYHNLIESFPFNEKLQSISRNEVIKVLDIGCGAAIFPTFLDKVLTHNYHLACDLLDLSGSSLRKASQVLKRLDHFSVNRVYQSLIEEIPTNLPRNKADYDLIWAIHSFTTVDIDEMKDVYVHLLELLAPNGCIFVYQLTSKSTYQKFYRFYLAHHSHGKNSPPFMEYEDSKKILDSIEAKYEVYELFFYHEIPDNKTDLLQKYLRKCILDDSVNVLKFFKTILEAFHEERTRLYRIPQSVNFIVISK